MRTSFARYRAVSLLTVLVAALTVTACAGNNWFSYTGWEAKPDNRYVLEEGGPHAVIWTSPELELHYRYRLEGDRLTIEGEVLRRGPIKHYSHLQAWVNVHLLDANGVILDTHRLWSQRGSSTYTGLRWDFQHSWQLPPENEAVGFSFSGVAGSRGDTWDFWQTP